MIGSLSIDNINGIITILMRLVVDYYAGYPITTATSFCFLFTTSPARFLSFSVDVLVSKLFVMEHSKILKTLH